MSYNYVVKFDFVCVSKRGLFSAKQGEIDIHTSLKKEEVSTNEDVIKLISYNMAQKTKKLIFSLDITEVETA